MLSPALLGAVLAVAPAAAHAQTVDPFEIKPVGPLLRNGVAGSRPQPEGEPTGVSAGALRVFPRATLRTGGDTNVLNRTAQKRGDAFVTLNPEVLAVGEAGQSRYLLQAEAAIIRYARLTGQNAETWSARAQASTPLNADITLAASGSLARRKEPNYTASAASEAGSATLLRELTGSIGARAELGLARLTRIGADRTVDPQRGAAYYTVEVEIPGASLRQLGALKLRAGMPAEAFIQTGSRTLLNYLTKPLADQFARAFR